MRWCDLIASRLVPIRVRAHLYRLVGIPIGQGTGIKSDVFIDGPALRVGSGCFINRFCKFDAVGADITVGDNVFMGFNVLVITSTHEHGTHDLRASHTTHAPVTIGRGSWIGANTTILPGVTIGDGCVIAAGSVVTADTKPDMLYAGVPATPKRNLP